MKQLFFILFAAMLNAAAFSQEVRKIRIDPAKAFGGGISEYFTDVEYIPLETTKESLFGDVLQLIITDSGFVVSDFDTKSVLFFRHNGRFIKKIKFKDNEAPNLLYNKQKQQVLVMIYSNGKFLNSIYSSTGQLIQAEIQEKILFEYMAQNFFDKNNSFILNSCSIDNWENIGNDTVFLVSLIRNGKLAKSFLPIVPSQNIAFCMLTGNLLASKIIENDIAYVCKPISNDIYAVKRDTVFHAFQFVFPQNRSYDLDLLKSTSKKYLDSVRSKSWSDPKRISGVSNIFFRDNLLFFKIMAQVYYTSSDGSENELQYNFIYDTLSSKLVSMERLTPDAASSFLPILGAHTRKEGLVFDSSKNIYSTISSLSLFTAHEKNKSLNPQYPPVLQEYFKTKDRKSNPVIVRMKMKE